MPRPARVAAICALGSLALTVTSQAEGQAIPRNQFWTTTRAATLVKATAKIPCAKLVPNPNHLPPAASCATQPPSPITGATVGCTGQGTPLKGTRRYRRFLCQWTTVNRVSYGTLQIYVTGASTFRWKVIT